MTRNKVHCDFNLNRPFRLVGEHFIVVFPIHFQYYSISDTFNLIILLVINVED